MVKVVAHFVLLFFLGSSLALAEPSCGGLLQDFSGVITSPNYPNNYPNDVTCHWIIFAEKSHVNLTIEYFMLEDSSNCGEFDFVRIKMKVGYRTKESTLCGYMASRQRSLKMDGKAIEIAFRSDYSFNMKGFKISYRAYDIDPCVLNNGGCSDNCSLVRGARVCSCPKGYALKRDKRTCLEENSCYFVGNTKCPYRTHSTCKDLANGTTKCVCRTGFREKDRKCQEINECEEEPDRCTPGTCQNHPGWFNCRCPKGYYPKHTGSITTCADSNECLSDNNDCGNATCVNTPGSFKCQCAPGYEFDDQLRTCQDINECQRINNACDHVCTNTEGSYICSCHSRYLLDTDGISCRGLSENQEKDRDLNVQAETETSRP